MHVDAGALARAHAGEGLGARGVVDADKALEDEAMVEVLALARLGVVGEVSLG